MGSVFCVRRAILLIVTLVTSWCLNVEEVTLVFGNYLL